MKRGYLPISSLGALQGQSDSIRAAEKVTKQRGTDVAGIFYSSAFQAGIDKFCIPDVRHPAVIAQSSFVATRTKRVSAERLTVYHLVETAFSSHLPVDWQRQDDFSTLRFLALFIGDLMIAASVGASILCLYPRGSVSEIIKEQDTPFFPSELYIPLRHLLSAISSVQTTSPVLQTSVLSTDDLQRFNDIITSDVFNRYSASQASLDDSTIPLVKALPVVASAGQKLFFQNRKLLALKRCSVNILEMTPKLIDAVFGKLPGALADVAAKLGISLIDSRRRLVIYDFRETVDDIFRANLVRMISGSVDNEGS